MANETQKTHFLKTILRSNKTVFSFKELILLWGNTNVDTLKARLNYYVKIGDLYHLRRGLYAKTKHYDHFELATKIITPSYLSFETVLSRAGIIFQHYSQLFVASYKSVHINCDGQEYVFKKIKSVMLTNAVGIEIREHYSIASPERAFLDTVYLYKDYHFDNLAPLNWKKIYDILPVYGNNRRIKKTIDRYYAFAMHELKEQV